MFSIRKTKLILAAVALTTSPLAAVTTTALPANAIPLEAGLPSGCDAYTLPGHTPTQIGGGLIQGDVWVKCRYTVFIQMRGTLVSSSNCDGYSTGSNNETGGWTVRYKPYWGPFAGDPHFAFCSDSGTDRVPIRTSGGTGGGSGGGGGGPW